MTRPVRNNNSKLPCMRPLISPYDRDFGSIKRLLRKMDRIYTPHEYADLILKASIYLADLLYITLHQMMFSISKHVGPNYIRKCQIRKKHQTGKYPKKISSHSKCPSTSSFSTTRILRVKWSQMNSLKE